MFKFRLANHGHINTHTHTHTHTLSLSLSPDLSGEGYRNAIVSKGGKTESPLTKVFKHTLVSSSGPIKISCCEPARKETRGRMLHFMWSERD